MREVGAGETDQYDAVEDQGSPRTPSPSDLATSAIVVRPHLHVQEIGAKWKDEGSHQSKRITSILHWDDFCKTAFMSAHRHNQ